MKKFFATFLAVALVAVACCVFASAEDTNLALNKSYDINGYDYDPTNVNYQDNETGFKRCCVGLPLLRNRPYLQSEIWKWTCCAGP